MATRRATRIGWLAGLAIGLVAGLSGAEEASERYANAPRYTWEQQSWRVAQQDVDGLRSPAGSHGAEREHDTAPVSAAPSPEPPGAIHYEPPSRGAPRSRVGGGTRTAGASLSVQALAPPHVALTMHDAPTLYWYLSQLPPETVRIEFTLLDEEGIDPVASFALPHPTQPGIQGVSLADHGVVLQPGIEYEWSIAVVVDPAKRSHDVVSTAWLRRVEPPADAADAQSARELARHSLWYDALATLSDEIASQPTNPELQAERDALLRQGELQVAVQ